MKRIMTLVFATLFAASTGALAAAPAKGDKEQAKTTKSAKKGAAMKSDTKEADAKKAAEKKK